MPPRRSRPPASRCSARSRATPTPTAATASGSTTRPRRSASATARTVRARAPAGAARARGHHRRGLRHAARPGPRPRAAPAVVPLRATEGLFVVYEPLAPVRLLQDIKARGIDWIAIDRDSYLAMGCNILAVRPGVVVMVDGVPAVRKRPRGRAASRSTSTTARTSAQGRRRTDLPHGTAACEPANRSDASPGRRRRASACRCG